MVRVSIFSTPVAVGLNYNIARIAPQVVEAFWPFVEEHIARCIPHSEGELEVEDFHTALTKREMQLWIAYHSQIVATMITQIVPYPQKKILRIIAIAGDDMDQWLPNLPQVEQWAASIGCSALECWGRKGWLRVLQDWKCSYHVLTKEIRVR